MALTNPINQIVIGTTAYDLEVAPASQGDFASAYFRNPDSPTDAKVQLKVLTSPDSQIDAGWTAPVWLPPKCGALLLGFTGTSASAAYNNSYFEAIRFGWVASTGTLYIFTGEY